MTWRAICAWPCLTGAMACLTVGRCKLNSRFATSKRLVSTLEHMMHKIIHFALDLMLRHYMTVSGIQRYSAARACGGGGGGAVQVLVQPVEAGLTQPVHTITPATSSAT